jgi:hypothetical protein
MAKATVAWRSGVSSRGESRAADWLRPKEQGNQWIAIRQASNADERHGVTGSSQAVKTNQ